MKPAAMAQIPAQYDSPRLLADEAETKRLAEELAAVARPGDVMLLSGDLGAGKSTLARFLIRTISDDPELEVPSPTFTLVQSYELPRLTVHHLDLYRLAAPEEVDELGIEDAEGLMLVEWPDRAEARFAGDRLEIHLALDPAAPAAREARLVGHGGWAARLERMDLARRFLADAGYGRWRRSFLQGDASKRRYERLLGPDDQAVFMDWPPAPDPGTGAVPYSRVAHLAEELVPFVAIAEALRAAGFTVPEIMAADLDAGFAVLEDLGCETVLDAGGRPVTRRYETAIDLLVALHGRDMPAEVAAAPGRTHRLPAYDEGAFLAEVELLTAWFAPHALGRPLPDEAVAEFRAIWSRLLGTLIAEAPPVWVLRDYHSPNLCWLPEDRGGCRIGLLDFQDAVRGPAAYDVASLVMDARVDVPAELRDALVARYVAGRRAGGAALDGEAFAAELAVMEAQRNTKVLGIFARLAGRDGKPGYLVHIPRIAGYLDAALRHPALAPLNDWHARHLPLSGVAGVEGGS